jgi:hypothetical protein
VAPLFFKMEPSNIPPKNISNSNYDCIVVIHLSHPVTLFIAHAQHVYYVIEDKV